VWIDQPGQRLSGSIQKQDMQPQATPTGLSTGVHELPLSTSCRCARSLWRSRAFSLGKRVSPERAFRFPSTQQCTLHSSQFRSSRGRTDVVTACHVRPATVQLTLTGHEARNSSGCLDATVDHRGSAGCHLWVSE
jgi:hypothetical protein